MSRSWPADSPPDVGVVIPAGGRGERAGGGEPKQFREIAGVPMLLRSIRPFSRLPFVREIVVALPAGIVASPPEWLADLTGGSLRLVPGGPTRADSVANGVRALSLACSTVLVHDAARPFVSTETILEVTRVARGGAAAVAAVPATDTLKRVDGDRRVVETVDRSTVWCAHTPQGFPRSMLQRAYDGGAGGFDETAPTDEATLVERMGMCVVVVPDSEWNLKITRPADFEMADWLAAR